MATAEARALTRAHQAAQAQATAQTVAELQALWPLLDWKRLDETWPLWMREVTKLVSRQRYVYQNLAVAYMKAFRAASQIGGTQTIVLADPASQEWVEKAMKATAYLSLKSVAADGLQTARQIEAAFVKTAGAVQRLSADAGRTTITRSLDADPLAIGYARVPRAGCCPFCALLATRGPVYKKETVLTASDGHRYHDHCHCTSEPLYRGMEWDPTADVQALNDLYREATKGVSGTKPAIHAFAKAYREKFPGQGF